jgi:hypothetical protein
MLMDTDMGEKVEMLATAMKKVETTAVTITMVITTRRGL